MKLFAFLMTDSVSLLSSLMDSAFDAVASLVTMLSVRHAMSPADEEHRFGHGKMEALSALGQAVFIFGSAMFLLFEAMQRFLHPQPIGAITTGISVMIVSIVLTGVLILFQIFVIRKTKSIAISADHLHYKGDLFMNLGVFLCLSLSLYMPWPYFDPIFAVVIALALLNGAREITKESFDILMDKELPQADREKIMALINEHKDVAAVHDLRTRSTGERIFIEFHLEMDGDMSLMQAHDITEDIEHALFEAYPTSEVLIHQEPAGIEDHRLDDKIVPIKNG
ncbi:MAG: cation diffusion facilitator family transporter [Alphaproteobacteria bacterium]|nr:cation diffusion facilitator family transporter [Alphaproteobacteria bacterium]